jgi:hypothetical protein
MYVELEEEEGGTDDNGGTDGALISTAAVAVVPQKSTNKLSTGSENVSSTGNGVEMVFQPLYWIAYWATAQLRKMATVSVVLHSGIARGTESVTVKPFVSMDGMYLTIKVLWPSILTNFGSMVRGWSIDDKLDTNHKARMMVGIEQAVEHVCKAAKVAHRTKMYAVCKIKLNFEVDRLMVDKLVLIDEHHGLLLQVILKEAKKDEDTTDHVLDVVRIASTHDSGTADIPFDLATVYCKNKRCSQNDDDNCY